MTQYVPAEVEHNLFVIRVMKRTRTGKWYATVAKDAIQVFITGDWETKAEAMRSVGEFVAGPKIVVDEPPSQCDRKPTMSRCLFLKYAASLEQLVAELRLDSQIPPGRKAGGLLSEGWHSQGTDNTSTSPLMGWRTVSGCGSTPLPSLISP